MHKEYIYLIYLVFIVAVVVAGPLLSIWALNTLFPVLAIPYTFETWCAAGLLGSALQSLRISNK